MNTQLTDVLCDECLEIMMNTISPDGRKIFIALQKHGTLNRKDLQNETGLSYTISGNAIDELFHKLLIDFREYGRAKNYSLTRSGKRLAELLEERG